MELQKSFYPQKNKIKKQKKCGARSLGFILCAKTLNREIGRKSWCHNGARDSRIVEVEKKMGFENFAILFLIARLPLKYSFAPSDRAEAEREWQKSKFPYLHRQPHCIVDELRRCRRANSRWTSVAFAYAFPRTSTNLADAVDYWIDRSGGYYARTCRCCGNSSRLDVELCCALPCDDVACCRWYDFVYDVTSYMADPGDPLMYTTHWGDIPLILMRPLLF